MNQELIIKSITIIGAIFLIIIIAYIIVLLKNHFFKSIKRNKKSRLTNKKKIFKKQKKSNPLANTPLSIQRTTRIESVHKPELNTQTPAVTIRKNKIMNTLQEEEIMKQKVLEKYMESYTTEGRKSILKSKIQKEEESKIYKEDQIQKVRNELLTGKEAHAEKTVPEKYDFKPNTAMIIDDNKFSQNMLRKILKEIDIEVVKEADAGVEAIELAEQLKPEFIFMDIKMSDIDGLTAAKLLIRKLPKSIIIVCSNHYDNNILTSLEGINVKGFIQKPFSRENVLEVIDEIKKML